MIDAPGVFLDTAYIIGLAVESDEWHAAAVRAESVYVSNPKFTTEGVFQEFLAHMSRQPGPTRADAVRRVRRLQSDARVRVLAHGTGLLDAALDLYEGEFRYSRLSLQDCVAIQVMRDFGMTDILTADQEFARAGVNPVLKVYG